MHLSGGHSYTCVDGVLFRYGVLTAYQNDDPVEFVHCNIGDPLVASGLLIATVQVLFVHPAMRTTLLGGRIANGLLNGMLRWNETRKGQDVMIYLTSGVKSAQTRGFLKRRGFVVIGGSYGR